MKILIAAIAAVHLASCAAMTPRLVPSNSAVFGCSPGAVTAGDTLVLSKNSPELRELAVRRPGSTAAHFLVVQMAPAEMAPLMSPEQLSGTRSIDISVDELTGLEWRVGATQEPIFTMPGKYRFILGSVLESEEPVYTCEVEYQLPRTGANNRSGAPLIHVAAIKSGYSGSTHRARRVRRTCRG